MLVSYTGSHSRVAHVPSLFLSLLVCSGSDVPGEHQPSCPQGWPQCHCPLQRQQQQFCPGEGAAGGQPAGCLCVYETRGAEPGAAGDPDPWQTCLQGKAVRGFSLGGGLGTGVSLACWGPPCPKPWSGLEGKCHPQTRVSSVLSSPSLLSATCSEFATVPLSPLVLLQLLKYLRRNFLTK